MQKHIIASAAIVSALALAGCSSATTTPATSVQTPAVDQSAVAPVTPAVTTTTPVTAADIEARLTAAGFKFTTKDKTAGAVALAHGSAVAKSTEFKVTVPNDIVILTVVELNDPAQNTAVTSDVQMQFIPAQGAGYKTVLAEMGSDSVVVGVIYKAAVEKDAWKVQDAVEGK